MTQQFPSRCRPKRIENIHPCKNLYIAAKGRKKQPRCPSADEGISKVCCFCTMEHYSAIRKGEVLGHATAWVNLDEYAE